MLVLSRKANESIQIGDDITVEIRRVTGNRVTIAINAPREVRILRGELERAAKEFEVDAAPSAETEPTVTHTRVRMPRLHSPYAQSHSQAVG